MDNVCVCVCVCVCVYIYIYSSYYINLFPLLVTRNKLSCLSSSSNLVFLNHSCWSGSNAPLPGLRTGPLRRPWWRCGGNWRTSGTTDASTSPQRCRRSASWKLTSTLCRPSCASAIARPSCPLRGRWCL